LQAHPDVVGIGGARGDAGKCAAIAMSEAGRAGTIVAMDRSKIFVTTVFAALADNQARAGMSILS
jgi:hypothetical protein